MITNFKTRNEARRFCWSRSIPLKNITRGVGSHPWKVESKETEFKVGKRYKLIDRAKFTNNETHLMNRRLADIIEKELGGIIEITKYQNGSGVFLFDNRGCTLINSALYASEASAFIEYTEPKAKATKKPKAEPVVPAIVPATPVSLDSELDGGVNLAPAPVVEEPKELDPKKFVKGRKYVLVAEEVFTRHRNHDVNTAIAKFYNKYRNGVYTISDVNKISGHAELDCTADELREFGKKAGMWKIVLLDDERQYFREFVPAAQTAGVKSLAEIEAETHAKKVGEAKKRVQDAMAKHASIMREFNDSINEISWAITALAQLSK